MGSHSAHITRFAQSDTFAYVLFASVLPTLCPLGYSFGSRRHVYTCFSITCARGEVLVHTCIHKVEWNRMDTSVQDPFRIRVISVQ